MTEYLTLRKSNILWKLHLERDTCFTLEEEFASSKRCQDKLTLQDQSKYLEKLAFNVQSYQFRSPDDYYVMVTPSIKQSK